MACYDGVQSADFGFLLDSITEAIFLLDPGGQVILANQSGLCLIRHGRGLAIRGEHLVADWPSETERLRRRLHTVADTAVADPRHYVTFAIARLGDTRPLAARLTRHEAPARQAWLLVTDTAHDPGLDHAALKDWYGLTRREAELAALLGAGATVEAATQALGVARGTIGTHLKHIYLKLGVNSHAQLVHMLARLPRHAAPAGAKPAARCSP